MFKDWRVFRSIPFTFLALGLSTVTSQASDLGNVEIHGYGHQGYLLANRNSYLTADDVGSFNYTNLSLVLATVVTPEMTIWGQISALSTDNSAAGVDWVFAENRVNGNFLWRAGQIRFPMGFYNESKRAKIVHLSTLEPLMYQDLRGEEVIPETFKGASAVYNHDIGDGNISLELFGGQRVSPSAERIYHRTYGATVSYDTPIDGLRLMATRFSSRKEDKADVPPIKGQQDGWLAGVEYVNNKWDLKMEKGEAKDPDLNIDTYYAQAGYTFLDALTPFIRYDYITTNEEFDSDPSYYQKDGVVGVGYKINRNLAIKLENHFMNGYAMPAKRNATGDPSAAGDTAVGDGVPRWNLFVASINFMF